MQVNKALTIAGSDSGGGAGIQSDLKTFQELNVYGMSAVTAVTAQNTRGVHGIYPVTAEGVTSQLEAIGADLRPDAVKTGMLFNKEIIEAAAGAIKNFGWNNLVVDPVMVAKGGSILLEEDAAAALKEWLIPLAKVITPNVPEAEVLTGMKIDSAEKRKKAAEILCGIGADITVIKGGHWNESDLCSDLVYDGQEFYELDGKRVATKNTHGTGCTFSAAITAELAIGKTPKEALHTAKQFIQAAVEYGIEAGSGHGPTNHWAYRRLGNAKR
ncbi:bifunctional hydroxymethylpyrimidine kinase/phosphomethylpyrimidine kinase [Fictibacillus aquaticus]|uniref:Hydroxymethylpyrimidine/phosphomethylpyrimidine kinase n=1 Tax=Fictibacillus aquaticus TaxID=2021314 RepID=A0A235FFU0_9BACL|nr:bifunctional hydroxymethylpyrimidine kinase/phosphomethylpyrimidine kinase [Fictibacillus aquaticus]OYD59824.1 bifunctional hydroxymethylpyrimidine kinase/phosphomethylpyrimidine kinase [Fictibacillus aquaticus]